MIKNFSLVLALVFILGLSFAMADQTVIINGNQVVDFTLTDLNFGSITPGSPASTTSTMTLNVANNVDFTLSICLQDSSSPIFENLILDVSTIGGSSTGDISFCTSPNPPVTANVNDADTTDTSTSQNFAVGGQITIPAGSLPGQRTATLVYTITGQTP